jgi:hypothetical protein
MAFNGARRERSIKRHSSSYLFLLSLSLSSCETTTTTTTREREMLWTNYYRAVLAVNFICRKHFECPSIKPSSTSTGMNELDSLISERLVYYNSHKNVSKVDFQIRLHSFLSCPFSRAPSTWRDCCVKEEAAAACETDALISNFVLKWKFRDLARVVPLY